MSKKLLLLLFSIHFAYIIFGFWVFARFTTLGDTFGYLNADLSGIKAGDIFLSATVFTNFFGAILSKLAFGHVEIASVPVMLMSCFGLTKLIERLRLPYKQQFHLVLLLCLPLFGVWSSVYGKEAFIIFGMCMAGTYLIDVLERKRLLPSLYQILGLYLIYIFKRQYLIAVMQVLCAVMIIRSGLRPFVKRIMVVGILLLDIFLLYYFADTIDALSFAIIPHFISLDAGSTREHIIWVNQYDFFRNMGYGMFIAFLGPTLSEVIAKPLQIVAFIESLILIVALLSCVKKIIGFHRFSSRFRSAPLAVLLILFFWILLVHYPFGVLNPGSATRYRSQFIPLLLGFAYYFAFGNGRFISWTKRFPVSFRSRQKWHRRIQGA